MGSKGCCGITCIKAVLYVFEFIIVVTGLAICGVGTWTFLKTYHFMNVLDSTTFSSAIYLFLATGSLVILVAILGCFAIPKHRTKLLFCYIILLVLIFLMMSLAGILSYIYQENTDEEMELNFNTTLLSKYKLDHGKTESIDYIQQKLECCGARTYIDWSYSVWLQDATVTNKVPDSCCKSMIQACGERDHPSNIFNKGCMDVMTQELKTGLWLICAVSLGLSVVEVFGIILGIVLFLKLEKSSYQTSDGTNGNERLLNARQL